MMKTFRKISMVLYAVLLGVSLVSCGDDDDENASGNPLIGTWAYTSTDGSTGQYTFKNDGTLVWDDTEEVTSNHTYTLTGNTLKMIFNDHDDYTEGTITFSGKTAVYRYFWADCAGAWKDEDISTMTLTRK